MRLSATVSAIAVAVAAALALPGLAQAAGGTYTVVLCDAANRGLGEVAVRENRGYSVARLCANAAEDNALKINSALARADKGAEGRASWTAPAETGFVRVRVQAKLRNDSGHRARVYMADARGRETRRVASGDGSPSPFKSESWDGARQEMVVGELRCESGPYCAESKEAKAWLRSLKLTLADFADPALSASGSLLGAGWRRGVGEIVASASDAGSGFERLLVRVNGTELARVGGECDGTIEGTSFASRLRPCRSASSLLSATPDTSQLPFRDGPNMLAICAYDFAGNESCETRTVQVDNTAPALAFTSSQDPDDPELIHAPVSDAHSGVASGQIYYRAAGSELWRPLETQIAAGELRARVDSSAVPPGTYEFRALARDAAGNVTETTRRVDGLQMRLEFPLKAGVVLGARLEPGGAKRMTIPYGRRARGAGVLRDASGKPLAGEEVVVIEHFGEGALIRERVTRVRTDNRGRWRTRLPVGPSRRVSVHYEGSQRHLPDDALVGALHVRTRASLRRSRGRVPEGGRVVFRGRLGRKGARVPSGGKLLELQVKQDKATWQTVGEGFRSNDNGRYRTAYRFGRFYQYDVRFKFRLKVAREADWPYKAPARSPSVGVTVLDR